ncbi:MAG: hypothetical protein QME58_13130 [Bacteroidota bacterium]|nr:hypothetical protein [Bacteroidota bacterium]
MLTHFVDEVIVFAPFVLSPDNWPFDSAKTNGVMPARYAPFKKSLFFAGFDVNIPKDIERVNSNVLKNRSSIIQ